MKEKSVRVGLVGFGTVGCGVARLLVEQGEVLRAKTGIRFELVCVVDLDTETPRPVQLPDGVLTSDLEVLLNDNRIEVAIELVGGTGIAKEIQLKMLRAGKHVVTANKALLAVHGSELYQVAREADRCIAFEASCAGGIPIVSALRTGLMANDITALYGIMNGTCNYILSKMTAEGTDFAETLKEAQAKGYAEADPTLDINGGDSSHKLTILGSLAFGYALKLEDVYTEGIEDVSQDDIRYADEMGYCLKLLAIGQKKPNGKVSLRVHPSLILKETALARVNGPFNAISLFGHAVGEVLLYGRGAGMMPTASAVVADVIEVALGNSKRSFDQMQVKSRQQSAGQIEAMADCESRFYIRIMAKDHPGVVAAYGKVLGDHGISISGVLQHEGRGPDDTVPVVIVTHETQEKNMSDALAEITELDTIGGKPVCIRIVDIPEDKDD